MLRGGFIEGRCAEEPAGIVRKTVIFHRNHEEVAIEFAIAMEVVLNGDGIDAVRYIGEAGRCLRFVDNHDNPLVGLLLLGKVVPLLPSASVPALCGGSNPIRESNVIL